MAKRYARLNWQNRPSTATPLNATNLNKMDKGIDDIDNAIDELDSEISTHLAQDVSQAIVVTRDMTLTGTQLVTGFNRKIKHLDIFGVMGGTARGSWGYRTKDNQNAVGYGADGNLHNGINLAFIMADTGSKFTTATATINADNTVTLTWSHSAGGVTGTARIQIVAHYHGEENI